MISLSHRNLRHGWARQSAALDSAACNAEVTLRRHSRSFSLAARFLPFDVRSDVALLYGFYRYLDELADSKLVLPDQSRLEIRQWRSWLSSNFTGIPPTWLLAPAIADLFQRRALPLRYTLDLLQGIEDDLYPRQVRTRVELLNYCYQVGGTVGLTLASLLDVRCTPGLRAACELGIAMQLTNILRDIAEDLSRNRIYLPLEDLRRFDLTVATLSRSAQTKRVDPQLQLLLLFYNHVAQTYYQRSALYFRCIRHDCQFAIRTAALLYSGILRVLERQEWNPFVRRAATTPLDKLAALAQAWRQTRATIVKGRQCPCRLS